MSAVNNYELDCELFGVPDEDAHFAEPPSPVEAFLAALWGGVHSLCVANTDQSGFRPVGFYDAPSALLDAAAAETKRKYNVWFGVHPLAERPASGRGGASDVSEVRVLVADLDWKSPAHADSNKLKSEVEVRATVDGLGEMTPSVIIDTGHGLQTYWLLSRPVDPDEGAHLTARMHLLLADLSPERDDLASVLRVPGSFNWKLDPVEVRIVGADLDRRFGPEWLDKRLPAATTVRGGTSTGSGRWRLVDKSQLHPLDAACLEELRKLGGHDEYLNGDGTISITGPHKKAGGSVSIGYKGPGQAKCWTPSWPPLREKGVYSLDDLEDIVAGRSGNSPGTAATTSDSRSGNEPAKRNVRFTAASEITPRPVRWMWDMRIALGTMALLAGREGIGKSTLAYTLAAMVTRGILPGVYYGTPKAVIVAATEDSWEHTIVPRLMAAGADLSKVFRVDVTTPDGFDATLTLPTDLAELEVGVVEHDAALILLDPLLSRLHASLDTHKDAEVRRALEPVVALADKTGAAVLGLIHVNKTTTGDPLNMIMGSRGFTAVARAVLFAMKSPDDENVKLLGQPKNNLGRTDLPTLTYTIVAATVAETDEGSVITGRIEWTGETTQTIGEALESSGETADARSATAEAVDWLRDYLKSVGGCATSAVIKENGHHYGHADRTIGRARKQIGLTIETSGFPRQTYWRLPPEKDGTNG